MISYRRAAAAVILPALCTCLSAQPIFEPASIFRPVVGKQHAVAVAEKHAAEVGLAILDKGGNAVDAAVAIGFTLAVTLPEAGNLGGGGFMVIHEASSGDDYALDYRETAPLSAHRDMFLDESGNADPELSRNSPFAVGVPGTVSGLLAAHQRFGTLPLEDLIDPAIQLAQEGIIINHARETAFKEVKESGRLDATAQSAYFGSDHAPPLRGERLNQPELAESLRRIASKGLDGFYKGKTAQAIVDTINSLNGKMSLGDLASYEPVWREPVYGEYQDFKVVSMPPPSSGGIHLVQMLNLLENFPLREWGQNSAKSVHVTTEVMKRAYADRSKYLGDPDFSDIPQEALLSEVYEQQILKEIDQHQVTASADIAPGILCLSTESTETTHFSIIDRHGNAVANTYTLNFSFGSGIMAKGTGILLNNEMDDFSSKPGVPNAFGLIGGAANAIEPRKRPLSSMTPTLLLKNGAVYMATGSPGGSRIINTVLQVILNVVEYDLNIAEAHNTPRFHHQWLPDTLYLERGFSVDTVRLLEQMGYSVDSTGMIGAAQSVVRHSDKQLSAAVDPRRNGGAALAR